MRALLGSDIIVLVASYTPTSFPEALTEAEKAGVAKLIDDNVRRHRLRRHFAWPSFRERADRLLGPPTEEFARAIVEAVAAMGPAPDADVPRTPQGPCPRTPSPTVDGEIVANFLPRMHPNQAAGEELDCADEDADLLGV